MLMINLIYRLYDLWMNIIYTMMRNYHFAGIKNDLADIIGHWFCVITDIYYKSVKVKYIK